MKKADEVADEVAIDDVIEEVLSTERTNGVPIDEAVHLVFEKHPELAAALEVAMARTFIDAVIKRHGAASPQLAELVQKLREGFAPLAAEGGREAAQFVCDLDEEFPRQ